MLSRFFPLRPKRHTGRKVQRRTDVFKQIASWLAVMAVAAIVGLLIWQFVSRMWVKPPVSSTRERTDLLVKAGEHIQLTVMNGSGSAGAARVFTDYLRARKFDVVEMRNYPGPPVEHTFIADKVGDSIVAEKVAYALGIDRSMIKREIDTNAFLDVAVVIGKDYSSTNPMR